MYHLTGDGSVFETVNNGKHVYMARVSLKHETTGKTITISGVGSTRKQAVQRRDANVQKRLARLDPSTDPATLPVAKTRLRARTRTLTPSQYLPIWESIIGRTTKQQTKDHHRQRLEQWVFPWLDLPMDTLTKPQLQMHFNTTLPNAGAGETSIYDAYGTLKALLKNAVENGYLKATPLTFILKKPVPKVLDEDKRLVGKRLSVFKGLVKEIADPDHPHHEHYALVMVMGLGLRRSEILGMSWKDFTNLGKPKKAVLHLRQQLIRQKEGGYYLQQSLKTSKTRTVPLPEPHRLALGALKEATAGEERTALAKDLVFTCEGDYMNYSRFTRTWETVLTAYMTKNGRELREDDYFRPHAVRKLAATMLAQAGVPVKVAAEILGHNPYVLLQTYQQPTKDDLRDATTSIGNALGG
ncbi:hypothetical protein GCM10009624_26980 [Gordonia sinesedis]